MWKLTVERDYEAGTEKKYTVTDRMHFESECLGELVSVIASCDSLGAKGEYKYKLENTKEKECKENAAAEAV